MTFIRKFDTLLHKSNKNIYKIDSEDGINLTIFNDGFKSLLSKKLYSGSFTFLDYWFDLDKDDNVYGIINNKEGSLLYYNIIDAYIIRSTLLKYNSDLRFIKFVYIKNENNHSDVFYYSIDNKNPYCGLLIHHHRKNSKWQTFIVDKISYNVLTNFIVIYDNAMNPTIFYYNLTNGFEELYASAFSNDTNTWSAPLQISHSKKPKIYLSVIQDSRKCYHILFSENNYSKYYCTYISGYINNNNFNYSNICVISNTVACTFPNIIEYNNKLYANWIEYHTLYYSYSKDYGLTWSQIAISNKSSADPFVCCNYHTNLISKNSLNYYTLFTKENSIDILGIE